MSNKDKLLLYIRGWKCGAGGLAFSANLREHEDFMAGHTDGSDAARRAYAQASKYYKAELSPLRQKIQ